ncbi:hypothetical protein UFOVP1613_50 [uncultured Caudovirales phage]|uniref:Uncharacterized protein n=1 Tax=uncultured Caudovirales phage TaxID=2100421 RepID=A0A6J5SXI4_9CAUD|nr:hypothetical protein UFOVP1613_50 [uncultured Caudovirales phage]
MDNPQAVSAFIGTLLHSATLTHIKHFQVTGEGSDAAHRALADYYEGITDLVDTVAESIQGAYDELITDYPRTYMEVTADPLEYMRALRTYVKESRLLLPQDSEIQNEIDGIASLINSTCYRLGFLR